MIGDQCQWLMVSDQCLVLSNENQWSVGGLMKLLVALSRVQKTIENPANLGRCVQ